MDYPAFIRATENLWRPSLISVIFIPFSSLILYIQRKRVLRSQFNQNSTLKFIKERSDNQPVLSSLSRLHSMSSVYKVVK